MSEAVKVRVRGLDEVKADLGAMAERARDLRQPLSDFGDALREFNVERFATSGNGTWSPLSPRYGAYKMRAVGPRPILVFNGDLLGGLTRKPMDIEIVTPRFASFGTTSKIARFHQSGTRHMPARPPLTMTESLENELNRLIADHIVAEL